MSGFTLKSGIVVRVDRPSRTQPLAIEGERIVPKAAGPAVSLKRNSYVYPALINTHDHLLGNYLPEVGPPEGEFYPTWLPWDRDFKASAVYQERSRLSREDLYALSGYKCLFSGVTTVVDHFPPALNRDLLPKLPVRAVSDYALAHEATSYDLQWGDGLIEEHEKAVKNGWPFITHLAEGFDDECMYSVEALNALGILDRHCLLVHCLGLSDEDIKRVARARASVAWCCYSNLTMFNVTCKIRKMLRAGVNVTIGTDSTATGALNILSEMRLAQYHYQEMYGEDLSSFALFKMATINAAWALWREDSLGALKEGFLADVLVMAARNEDPFENLVDACMEDIELLTRAGTPIYGEERFVDLLGARGNLPEGYTWVNVGGRRMFVVGDPAGLYTSIREKLGFEKDFYFLPFQPDGRDWMWEG